MLAIYVCTVTCHVRAASVDTVVRVMLAIKATGRLIGLEVRTSTLPPVKTDLRPR